MGSPKNPETLILLLSASAVLLGLLVFILYLPRILKKKEHAPIPLEMDAVMGAFSTLGGEIKSLKEQLVMKERLAALGEVAAGIAHELRNPMGVIAGYARLLMKGFEETDAKKEIVQAILNEIEEMDRVMEELLKFSKSEPLNKRDVELVGLVQDIIKGLGKTAPEIKFSPCPPIAIEGDAILLRQAVKNLLQNALQSGDKIRIDIEQSVTAGKEGFVLSIKDNGSGIPEADFNRIFMPFYTTKSRGSGIGLALVQKIALAHGGSVTVNSREGKGSTFRLFLPKQDL